MRIIRRQRKTYNNLVDDSLSDAESLQKKIQGGLNQLQDKIDDDENQTFRQELHLRLTDFNPLAELKELVFGKDQTP